MASIKTALENIKLNLEEIGDKKIKDAIILLFNIIEEEAATIDKLRKENQILRDENNQLKGEQPKPKIKANKNKQDISSENERKNSRRKRKKRKKSSKKEIEIVPTRTEKCELDKSSLPGDAEFKGYEPAIIYDIIIRPEIIKFEKEVYYSKSKKKTYIGQLPPGYSGKYGPRMKSLAIILKFVCNMTEPKILEFFQKFNLPISAGTISNMLIKNKDEYHTEKEEIFLAGLGSSVHQQIDDTSAKVNGDNHFTHVLCNDLYAAYFTRERKDRLTILDILRNIGKEDRKFLFCGETFALIKKMKVPEIIIKRLMERVPKKEIKNEEMNSLLDKELSNIKEVYKTRILEAAAIASYQKEAGHPIVQILICDDAPQFKLLTKELGLCWVHDGRHYKKLIPVIPYNKKKLENFIKKYWNFYKALFRYKKNPSKEKVESLSERFDKLFSTKTNYKALDDRIAKTKKKRKELLLVLKHPHIPLHNNESELNARAKVRFRDVSLQTRTDEGTKASDTFLTLVQTAKKLSVNIYEYIYDRISEKYELPSLADIIIERSVVS